MIIFVGGLPGAGKSSVARALAKHLGLFYYDVDQTKVLIYKEDPDYKKNMEQGIPFCEETRLKVYHKVVADFSKLSTQHKHLVVDEALHIKKLREILFRGAEAYFDSYIIMWVKASEEVILARLTSTVREGHILKDPVIMHNAILRDFEPFEESLIICRNNGTLKDTIKRINQLFDNIAVCAKHF